MSKERTGVSKSSVAKSGDKAKKLRLTRETIKDLDTPPSKERNVKGGGTSTQYGTTH